MTTARWFPFADSPHDGSSARPRLICLPWAGGVAASFRPWIDPLRDVAAVYAAEMPGHGVRFGEPCRDEARRLAAEIAKAIRDLPRPETPVMIYGHSMGALLGFEVARILAAEGKPPLGLMLTGRCAPHWRGPERNRWRFDDAALVEDLREMGGTPPEVFESQDLMSLVLPILRSDYRLAETYRPNLDDLLPKLSLPVDVIGGADDEDSPREGLDAWREVFGGPLQISLWEGGHFFIEEHCGAVIARLRRHILSWSQAAAVIR